MSELVDNLATKLKETEDVEDSDNSTILKTKTKAKRACSEKQLEALKKNRECSAKARKDEAEEKKVKRAVELIEKNKLKEKVKEVVVEPESKESESEDEEIIIKKKKKEKIKEKPKKKKKVITIEISDSDDTDTEEEEEEPVKKQVQLKARQMITLQNKKSLIKVHKQNEATNYFCD